MQALLRKIRQILKDRRTRKFFTRVISSVAAIVVFVTTYALILPAITLEKTAVCGIEAHQHDDSCYEERLVCGQEESGGHHHDESCYSTVTELTCGMEEHRHSEDKGCYDADEDVVGIAGDWSQAMYGTVEGVKIDYSADATLVAGESGAETTISLFQQNMFEVRAEIELGFRADRKSVV